MASWKDEERSGRGLLLLQMFIERLNNFKEKRVMLGGLQTEKRIRDFTIMEETNKYIK
jgi:hypothetical protein